MSEKQGIFMFHVAFYVPKSNVEEVKEAMFNAGGGKIGNYDSCSFETPGKGQFRPLAGSLPHLGQQDKLEVVEELKVEMICTEETIEDVIEALKKAHPYETPAYYVIETLDY